MRLPCRLSESSRSATPGSTRASGTTPELLRHESRSSHPESSTRQSISSCSRGTALHLMTTCGAPPSASSPFTANLNAGYLPHTKKAPSNLFCWQKKRTVCLSLCQYCIAKTTVCPMDPMNPRTLTVNQPNHQSHPHASYTSSHCLTFGQSSLAPSFSPSIPKHT